MRRGLLAALMAITVGCSAGTPAAPPVTTSTTAPPPPAVTLSASSISWQTHAYELTRFNTILRHDPTTVVDVTFDTWVLENEHLRVELLPEFGGRIISMIAKDTGREQLYRTPVGVPYQIGTGVFYFDWLMVYGGIFPTFPAPEHGKTWFSPWTFEVVEESPDSISVAMSFTDSDDYPLSPRQYDGNASGLTVTWLLTLDAGRSALDTEVVISNPGPDDVRFEYWTNATLAPGADPAAPVAVAETEIVAPIDFVEIPAYWSAIAASEVRTGIPEVHEFDRLRTFGGWDDLGIAYAWPDVRNGDAWGAINQVNGDGIIRVGDSSVTPGLKLWTWGYERSLQADPPEAGPYVEMWAGLTREFFQSTTIGPGEEIRVPETWVVTRGMRGVTDGTRELLFDAALDDLELSLTLFTPAGPEAVAVTASDPLGPLGAAVAQTDQSAMSVVLELDRDPEGPITLTFDQRHGTSSFELHS
jgi:hypothetical protein